MKIKIFDSTGQQYRCDSSDPELIGQWFMERASYLVQIEGEVLPMYLHMWPSTQAEKDILGEHSGQITPDSLRTLAGHLTEAAAWLEAAG